MNTLRYLEENNKDKLEKKDMWDVKRQRQLVTGMLDAYRYVYVKYVITLSSVKSEEVEK